MGGQQWPPFLLGFIFWNFRFLCSTGPKQIDKVKA